MFISKNEYERLQEEVARLRAEKDEYRTLYLTKEKERQYSFLKDYKYAILMPIDEYYPKIWNEGRYEEHVREVAFNSGYGMSPELRIRK